MDPVRFGLAIRALRRQRGWTQVELARRARLSQSAISRIERGGADRVTHRMLMRVVGELGARVRVQLLAHGEDIDRLLDADHAEIVERVSAFLRRHGWEVVPEATFNIYGERGSIDILAFHPLTGSLLVIEVKSAVPDVQATLSGIDRKARLATKVAHDRGWRVGSVSRWLVVPDTTTTRRRIELHSATFGAALPSRTIALRRWAADPTGAVAGILFVPPSTRAGHRHRIRAQSARNATSHPRGG